MKMQIFPAFIFMVFMACQSGFPGAGKNDSNQKIISGYWIMQISTRNMDGERRMQEAGKYRMLLATEKGNYSPVFF